MSAARYPVVVFDLDGTLLRGTSVSLWLAEWMGQGELIAELEREFHAGKISNHRIADVSAGWFRGVSLAEVWGALEGAPWIDGIDETTTALAAAGCQMLLGTITWKFAAEMLREMCGFAAVSGTEIGLEGEVLSGRVGRYIDEFGKLCFVEEWCVRNGYRLDEVAAVGDSRSDVPLFEKVSCAIALNATEDARAVATVTLDTDCLTDVLAHLLE